MQIVRFSCLAARRRRAKADRRTVTVSPPWARPPAGRFDEDELGRLVPDFAERYLSTPLFAGL